MNKKLTRNEDQKIIGGVCAGIAEYFGMDVSIVRVIFGVSLVLKGVGLPLYFILWAVLPKKNIFNEPFVDYRVPPFEPFAQPFDAGVPPVKPNPFMMPPAPKKHTAGLVIGLILLMIGSFCLLNEFDWIPDWDFDHFWPIIPIVIGLVFIVNGSKKSDWEKQNWNKENINNDYPEKESQINENPTTL